MAARRCDTCEFWVEGEPWGGEQPYPNAPPDERRGTCHRAAPHTSFGDHEYQLLRHLTLISWQHATEEEQKREFRDWEEVHCDSAIWPTTEGSTWCGEWKERVNG
jgi:hypothetical protein